MRMDPYHTLYQPPFFGPRLFFTLPRPCSRTHFLMDITPYQSTSESDRHQSHSTHTRRTQFLFNHVNCFDHLQHDGQRHNIRIIGTGLYLIEFEPESVEIGGPILSWRLVFHYYARSPTSTEVSLCQATLVYHRYKPSVHFIVMNRLDPRAPIEVTYYAVVYNTLAANYPYQLSRVDDFGNMLDIEGNQIPAFLASNASPVGKPPILNGSIASQDVADAMQYLTLERHPDDSPDTDYGESLDDSTAVPGMTFVQEQMQGWN
jgi:hypothetical protein